MSQSGFFIFHKFRPPHIKIHPCKKAKNKTYIEYTHTYMRTSDIIVGFLDGSLCLLNSIKVHVLERLQVCFQIVRADIPVLSHNRALFFLGCRIECMSGSVGQ